MVQNRCIKFMNEFVAEIKALNYLEFLPTEQARLDLGQYKISQITPEKATQIQQLVYIKFQKSLVPKSQLNWNENQLRLFMWILVCYTQLKNVSIQNLVEADWEYFSSIIPGKKPILFEYQSKSLVKNPSPSKKWINQEDQLFMDLYQGKAGKNKWASLAKEIYIVSDRKFYRTPKQCRERWQSHLDPNKSTDPWQKAQEHLLIHCVHQIGRKWAYISKKLKNRRSEHTIKNHFVHMINKEKKLHLSAPKEEKQYISIILAKYEEEYGRLETSQSPPQTPTPTSPEVVQPTHDAQHAHETQSAHNPQPTQPAQPGHDVQHSNHEADNISVYFDESSYTQRIQQQQKEKQIRFQMFLSTDPYDWVKKFYKTKDSLNDLQ